MCVFSLLTVVCIPLRLAKRVACVRVNCVGVACVQLCVSVKDHGCFLIVLTGLCVEEWL